MKNRIAVVAASPDDQGYAIQLLSQLEARGHDVWSLDGNVIVGDSLISAIDSAIRESVALILVRSRTSSIDNWSLLQQHAFQTQVRLSGFLKLIVISRDYSPEEPTVLAQATVLPPGLSPESAAHLVSGILVSNPDESSYQISQPVDNRNSPLLKAGAWPLLKTLRAPYEKYSSVIGDLLDIGHYEKARDIYWESLYYSGYHELWESRLALSGRLIAASRSLHDLQNAGLASVKGMAYVYMNRGQPEKAVSILEGAFKDFYATHDARGQAICWTYLADVYTIMDRLPDAEKAYEQAAKMLKGSEREDVEHKIHFMRAAHRDLEAAERVAALISVRDQFALFADYREGLADLEIARTLITDGANTDAVFFVRQAADFFGEKLMMPRHASRALHLLENIRTGSEVFTNTPVVLL